MLVWRICKQLHIASAFSGIGAEKYGGRWNHKGDRMAYTSSSLSAEASLRTLCPSGTGVHIPSDLVSIVATVPDTVSREELTVADPFR